MFALVDNQQITKHIIGNRGITIGNNQYPRSIFTLWSESERNAIGIYEIIVDTTNKKDEQYYTNTNISYGVESNRAVGSYGSATAKSLVDVTDEDDNVTLGLKSQTKQIIKQQASGLLTPTDWYVIKATDVESYSVPSAITTFRTNVRTRSNEMEVLIEACSTVDELAVLYVYTDGTRPLGEFPILEI